MSERVYFVRVTEKHEDDYRTQFLSLLKANNFEHINTEITPENFPGECICDFDAVLYRPDFSIGYDDVLKELDKLGLRPARMIELLAFGVRFPDVQQEFQVIELGSSGSAQIVEEYCGYLYHWDGKRVVLLDGRRALDCFPFACFLAVPKTTQAA